MRAFRLISMILHQQNIFPREPDSRQQKMVTADLHIVPTSNYSRKTRTMAKAPNGLMSTLAHLLCALSFHHST